MVIKKLHFFSELQELLSTRYLKRYKKKMIKKCQDQNVKKNIPHVSIQWKHPNLFIKLSRQLIKTEVNQWGHLQERVRKDNPNEFSWRHLIQILSDEARSIYFWKVKRKLLKQIQKSFKQTKTSYRNNYWWHNLYAYINPNIWTPNLPYLNPLDYYVWSVVEETDEHPHNTNDSLKAAIFRVMSNMNKNQLIRACNQFQSRIEAVINSSGYFMEKHKSIVW